MTPQPLKDLRQHIEYTQASVEDPAERDRALAVVEKDLKDMLGVVTTYRNDARLQMEGNAANGNGNGSTAPTDGAEQRPQEQAPGTHPG